MITNNQLNKNELFCYYQELQYVNIESTVDQVRVLNENMFNNLEVYIIKEEALRALKTRKKNQKSLESDGFTK